MELRFAIGAGEERRRTYALVEVDVRDTSGAISTVVIGTNVTRGVTVAVGPLEARLAQTSIAITADRQAAGPVFAQMVITDVVSREHVVTPSRVPRDGRVTAV